MGAGVSHFAHPKPGHRLKRLQAKDLDRKVQCGMCGEEIVTNGATTTAYYYSCQQCVSFVLHDACFKRQQTIDSHWAHLVQPSHPLTLSDKHLTDGRSCSICAGAFRGAFVYGCGGGRRDCHGFLAHPSCLDLSRTLTTDLHRHKLMLMSPPRNWRRGSCIDTSCRNSRSNVLEVAWSYQCHECRVHVCLSDGESTGTASPGHRCCFGGTGHGCGAKEAVKASGCLGEAMGTFGRRFLCACMGNNNTAA